MLQTESIIGRKRDGRELDDTEITAFVRGVSDGSVTDAQIAAFTMATWLNGMTSGETARLTLAMRDSGRVLSWQGLDGPVLDKHSTGGVGDMTSLVLGPVVAACGGYVPMISGRGLGHTGGTLDKLESIPGFDCRPGIDRFRRWVGENGIAIVGQSDDLAPADRRIYAVRDVTATVSAPPLMISSILSKKLAEGLDGLVLDIKYGSGAFTAGPAEGVQLAGQMTAVATDAGLACSAVVSDMNAPLARAAGNALEIREAVRFLRGEGAHARLEAVSIELSAELLVLGGLAGTVEAGRGMARECIASGRAAERFARMVAAQGGPADLLERVETLLPQAPVVRPVEAERAGFVQGVDTQAIGKLVVLLGGGRQRAEDAIDPAVGLDDLATPGERIERGAPLATVHAAGEDAWAEVAGLLKQAYVLADEPPHETALFHATIKGG